MSIKEDTLSPGRDPIKVEPPSPPRKMCRKATETVGRELLALKDRLEASGYVHNDSVGSSDKSSGSVSVFLGYSKNLGASSRDSSDAGDELNPYKLLREKNNDACRRHRRFRKQKEIEMNRLKDNLEMQNLSLQSKAKSLEKQVQLMRIKLKVKNLDDK